MRKTILIISCIAIGFMAGCGASRTAKHDSPLNIWFESENGNFHVLKVVDSDTKVNYIVVEANTGMDTEG